MIDRLDRWAIKPPMIVHVGNVGRPCRTGILVAEGTRVSAFRVLDPRGRDDDETGDLRHWTDALVIPNPDGSERRLDTWHHPEKCGQVVYS